MNEELISMSPHVVLLYIDRGSPGQSTTPLISVSQYAIILSASVRFSHFFSIIISRFDGICIFDGSALRIWNSSISQLSCLDIFENTFF